MVNNILHLMLCIAQASLDKLNIIEAVTTGYNVFCLDVLHVC